MVNRISLRYRSRSLLPDQPCLVALHCHGKRPPLAFFYPLRSFLASVLSSFPVHTLHISVPSPLDVFYGTKCQDKFLSPAHVALQRRRPLPVGTCGVACPRSDREGVPDLDFGPRVPRWHRNRLPVGVTDDPRSSFRRWHPRRDRSRLSSHQMREPSFYLGLVRPMLLLVLRGGIALSVGLSESCSGARSAMDTLPRTKLVSRYCANRHLLLGDRRLHT
jgi:hypothetical protein